MNKNADQLVAQITQAVQDAIRENEYNEAMGGGHSTIGGLASTRLEYWLDGYKFGITGQTVKYNHIVEKLSREADPEYQQYIKLKEKFGEK